MSRDGGPTAHVDPQRLRAFESTACQAARRAGELLRRAFDERRAVQIRLKGLHDFVTDLDREAEDTVVEVLRERFPDHGIVAEERPPEPGASGYRWIVDPLDGTTNFIHGFPHFAVSVALEDGGGLLAAAIYDVMRDQLFHGSRGAGARRDGRPIAVRPKQGLENALLSTGFPFRELSRIKPYLRAFEMFVGTTAGLRRAGSAALDLAHTACGIYDGFWEFGLSPWDLAAGALLVRESGGVVTDVTGDHDTFLHSGDIVAAGPALHPEMLRVIQQALREHHR